MRPDSQFVTLSIDGMTCGGCASRADRALAGATGVGDVSVNLAAESARFSVASPSDVTTAVNALDTAGYPARRSTLNLQIENLSCASCVARAEEAIKAVPGVLDAAVNLATETARVTYLDGVTGPDAIGDAATDRGYPARLSVPAATASTLSERRAAEASALSRRLILAAALTLPVFAMEMGSHLIPAVHHAIMTGIGQEASWLIQWVLTTLVLIGPGRSFYTKGIPALLRGAPDMNSLVAVGTGAAYLYSLVATFAPSLIPASVRAVYFEAAAVIVVLILLGRWLEARAKGRTGAAIEALLSLGAKTARVREGDTWVDTPTGNLRIGDLILVRPGERIATDGDVVEGNSHLDESMLTGEPVPRPKSPGDPVTGGTLNGAGALTIRATRVGADTTLAQIIRMVEDAQGAKLPIQGLVDRITLWFVPAVMALATLTVLIWLVLGPEPALTHALVAGVSVLIIACPCAMGLATPTSIMVGTGRAAQLGVLFRKGDALQALGSVRTIAFDKTGTITQGRPELTDLILAPNVTRTEALELAAAIEAASEHPIASAILRAAEADGISAPAAKDFAAIPGYGVSATIAGQPVLAGAARLMTRNTVDIASFDAAAAEFSAKGHSLLYLARGGLLVALISVSDPVKPTSRAAISALKSKGLGTVMITGDSAATAHVIAEDVGIDHVIAEVLPEGKQAVLRDLPGPVAFVGDGINDAPALAQADIGIAIGTGTDVAIEAADVVLTAGDLTAVVTAHTASTRTMANIRQNLFWAFGYNVALVPVAMGVLYPAFGLLLSPVLAAGAMALSSVFVVTNALRLRRLRAPLIAHPGTRP